MYQHKRQVSYRRLWLSITVWQFRERVYIPMPWNNLPKGKLTPMGIYQMNQTDGYEIKPFLINSAVYSNGGGAFIGDTFYSFFLDSIVWRTTDMIIMNTPIQKEKFSSCPSLKIIIARTML